VLSANEVEAVLAVNGVRADESPLTGAGRSCSYRVAGGWSSHPEVPEGLALDLFISDVATYAEVEREGPLLLGERTIALHEVDSARIATGDGAASASLSLVRGDRTARLFLWVNEQSGADQQRILDELAAVVVRRWLTEDSQ
jgi:hypothetical protein